MLSLHELKLALLSLLPFILFAAFLGVSSAG
jgi:hypothetical protein